MPISKRVSKPLRTIKEDSKWKNLESINTKTKKITKNPILIEETKKWKLPLYEVVEPKKRDKFLRSKKDEKKGNNLDPKIKIVPSKKVDKKK